MAALGAMGTAAAAVLPARGFRSEAFECLARRRFAPASTLRATTRSADLRLRARAVGPTRATADFRESEESRARGLVEAFAEGGDVTEEVMERLVEDSIKGGQSWEDYRRRAAMQSQISKFFSQKRTYVVQQADSAGGSELTGSMQEVVEAALACEGRSATDYNCRAQLFAKSAESFPYAAGRS